MKKIWIVAAFLLLSAGHARAWIFEQIPEKTVTVRHRLDVAGHTSTAAVVIDLSDTTNWPHKESGQINITSMRVEIDKAAASTTTVRLGVVNFVNASTGSVTWFHIQENELNVSNTEPAPFLNYAPTFLKLKTVSTGNATDGTTPYILGSDKTSGSTVYQTDTALPAASGTVAPGRGDVVVFIHNGAGAINLGIEIQYHSEK